MQLGIGSYTYGWSTGVYGNDVSQQAGFTYVTAQELVDKAVRLEVPLVQICVKPDLAGLGEGELRAVRRYAEAKGRTLEIGTVGSDPDHLRHFLYIAQTLGARLVRTIFRGATPGLVDERRSIGARCGTICQCASLSGHRKLRSDPLPRPAISVPRDRQRVRGRLPGYGQFVGRGEGVREVTEALMPFTKCLHIKDFTVVRHSSDMELTIMGAPAGEGKLDIPAQLKMLQKMQPQASVVLEQWTPFHDTLAQTIALEEEWAETGLRYLKTHLAQLLP